MINNKIMSNNKTYRKFLPSRVRSFIIDSIGNLSIDFGDKKKDKFLGISPENSIKIDSSGVLTSNNKNILVTTKDIILKFNKTPIVNDSIRIVNDSGGTITLDGNSKLIDDVETFNLFDGEVLGLVFNNNKWM